MNIVILGAGCAGITAALRLSRRGGSDFNVTLATESPYFVERIRLHENAAGRGPRQRQGRRSARRCAGGASHRRLPAGLALATNERGQVLVDPLQRAVSDERVFAIEISPLRRRWDANVRFPPARMSPILSSRCTSAARRSPSSSRRRSTA